MNKDIKRLYKKTEFDFSTQQTNLDPSNFPFVWKKVFYKIYSRFPKRKIEITPPSGELEQTLLNRRTTREFSREPLSFEFLSDLLRFSVGLSYEQDGKDNSKRVYPSAGARYPIETYLVNNNVKNLDNGLYHYNVRDECLERLVQGDLSQQTERIIGNEMGLAPLLVFLTGVMPRTEVKYGPNAYRFALIESGHIGQNISLFCEKEKIGSCAIGGFDNKVLCKLLDLTSEELPLYAFAIGRKNEN